jgi:uncharacterized membrane protein YdjX (TVP38/TMEM64 family)
MPKRIVPPLTDTKIRTIKPAEKPQKILMVEVFFSWSLRTAASLATQVSFWGYRKAAGIGCIPPNIACRGLVESNKPTVNSDLG